MMLSNISAFASLKLTFFKSLLKERKKKSQANLEWRSRACYRDRHGSRLRTPWTLALKRFLVTVQSVLSVATSILSCIFLFFIRQIRALYASSYLFCAPPPTLNFLCRKRWSGLWICGDVSSGGNVEGRNSHVHRNGRTSKPSASTRLLFAFSTHEQRETVTVDSSLLSLVRV